MAGQLRIGPGNDPDRVRLGPAVASGAEGVLYKAYLDSDGRAVEIAVKMLQPGHLGRLEEWATRWREQAELLARVEVAGLVSVRTGFVGALPHPAGFADPSTATLYLLMDWVEGVSLDRWAKSVHADEPEQLLLALVPVAAALDLLHSGAATKGVPVVHRDVKVANILVRPGGDTVLVDVGSVRGLVEVESRSGVVGTPGYIAPEVRTDGAYTPAADRYSLGAVAFALLVGHEPPEQGELEVLRAHLLAAPLLHARPELVEHVLAMLDPDPGRRPSPLANWVAQLRRSSLVTLAGESTLAPRAARRNPRSSPATQPRSSIPGDRPAGPARGRLRLPLAVLLVGAVAAAGIALVPDGGSMQRNRPAAPARTTVATPVPPDFHNMIYPAGSCGEHSARIEVRNGARPVREGDSQDYPMVSVESVVRGDLDGAGPDEVVVSLQCAYGMTDHRRVATVWGVRDGAYTRIIQVPRLGDQASYSAAGGGFSAIPVRILVDDGMLVVTEQAYEAFDGNCCPSTVVTTVYRLRGDTLAVEGPQRVLPQARSTQLSNYPYLSLLNGLGHEFDVSSIATPVVIERLAAEGLFGARFPEAPDCVDRPDGGQRCRVTVTVADETFTVVLIAHDDDGTRGLSPVDTLGAPQAGKRAWIVDGVTVEGRRSTRG